jgi:hypothetical protein
VYTLGKLLGAILGSPALIADIFYATTSYSWQGSIGCSGERTMRPSQSWWKRWLYQWLHHSLQACKWDYPNTLILMQHIFDIDNNDDFIDINNLFGVKPLIVGNA